MIIQCKHWQDCGVQHGGCCAIGEYSKPSFGVCLNGCEKNTDKPDQETIDKLLSKAYRNHRRKFKSRKPPSRGLGDTVKKVIDKITRKNRKPCGGCKKRQEALNKLLPYKQKGGK